MPFHARWHDRVADNWTILFRDVLDWCDRPGLRFLEIGCFEGRATVWMLTNVLTHPTCRIDVIDTFAGSPELAVYPDLLDVFYENTESWRGMVQVWMGESQREA